MRKRDFRGRFKKVSTTQPKNKIIVEHNYCNTGLCDCENCGSRKCASDIHRKFGNNVSTGGWREGRRVVEFGVLLENIKWCKSCRLGPVPLTFSNVVGELQKGLSGYLYVVCQNVDCGFVNRVAYGKVHHMKSRGMPCFDINTKLGTAMIDSLGGP